MKVDILMFKVHLYFLQDYYTCKDHQQKEICDTPNTEKDTVLYMCGPLRVHMAQLATYMSYLCGSTYL